MTTESISDMAWALGYVVDVRIYDPERDHKCNWGRNIYPEASDVDPWENKHLEKQKRPQPAENILEPNAQLITVS